MHSFVPLEEEQNKSTCRFFTYIRSIIIVFVSILETALHRKTHWIGDTHTTTAEYTLVDHHRSPLQDLLSFFCCRHNPRRTASLLVCMMIFTASSSSIYLQQ